MIALHCDCKTSRNLREPSFEAPPSSPLTADRYPGRAGHHRARGLQHPRAARLEAGRQVGPLLQLLGHSLTCFPVQASGGLLPPGDVPAREGRGAGGAPHDRG